MTYRISRHLTTSTFTVGNQLCKLFLEPMYAYQPGYWIWNLGYAVGKSPRQLNDWYNRRNNKRKKSIDGRITGTTGMKAFSKGVQNMLRLRWHVEPGDIVMIDCTSGQPEKQFRAYWYWVKRHQDWTVDVNEKKIFWYRPPYPDDVIRQQFRIHPVVPADPLANTLAERYFDCFRVEPKVPCTDLSMEQTLGLLGQVLNS